MKQIKTIICVTSEQDFDNMVNIAISDGWTLVKRDILPPYETTTIHYHRALYAELERDTDKTKRCCEACGLEVKCTDEPCIKDEAILPKLYKAVEEVPQK